MADQLAAGLEWTAGGGRLVKAAKESTLRASLARSVRVVWLNWA